MTRLFDFDFMFDKQFGCFEGDIGYTQWYKAIETENGVKILFNACGMSKDDISVKTGTNHDRRQYVEVSGKSSMENVPNKFNKRLFVKNKIKTVKPKVEKGILITDIIYDIEKPKDIPVEW